MNSGTSPLIPSGVNARLSGLRLFFFAGGRRLVIPFIDAPDMTALGKVCAVLNEDDIAAPQASAGRSRFDTNHMRKAKCAFPAGAGNLNPKPVVHALFQKNDIVFTLDGLPAINIARKQMRLTCLPMRGSGPLFLSFSAKAGAAIAASPAIAPKMAQTDFLFMIFDPFLHPARPDYTPNHGKIGTQSRENRHFNHIKKSLYVSWQYPAALLYAPP